MKKPTELYDHNWKDDFGLWFGQQLKPKVAHLGNIFGR